MTDTSVEHNLEPAAPPALPEPAPVESAPALAPGVVRIESPPTYGARLQAEWAALHPSLRAALTCWPAILVFAILAFGSLGLLVPFCYPVQLVVYGVAGALAVRWARQSRRVDSAFALGLLAGVALAGLDILTYFAVNVLVGAATGGLGLAGLCCMAGLAPLDATISTLVGGLGGVIYEAMA